MKTCVKVHQNCYCTMKMILKDMNIFVLKPFYVCVAGHYIAGLH